MPPPESGSLSERLTTIEAALDRGDYSPGVWRRLVNELRERPQAERAGLATEISEVSRKLHLRRPLYTTGVLDAVLIEALVAIVGGILVADGIARNSNPLAVAGMLLWVASFEPLLKLSVGTAIGVEYDYMYLYRGVEPRFKLKFGMYLSLAPLKRAVFQFAGTLGSPLGALIAARLCAPALPTARVISLIAFWLLLIPNVGGLVAELANVRRIGAMPLPPGSANELIAELRCWWRT